MNDSIAQKTIETFLEMDASASTMQTAQISEMQCRIALGYLGLQNKILGGD